MTCTASARWRIDALEDAARGRDKRAALEWAYLKAKERLAMAGLPLNARQARAKGGLEARRTASGRLRLYMVSFLHGYERR